VQRAATGHSQGIERVVREWMMGEVGNWVREYVRESLVLSETKSSTPVFPSLPFPSLPLRTDHELVKRALHCKYTTLLSRSPFRNR
jgi:hypothetical protein